MKTRQLIAACLAALALPAPAIVISYRYDSAGRLTSANYGGVSSTSYAYDSNGNLLSRTNSVSQFVTLAGTYTGLIAATPVSSAGAGVITLTVSLTGEFTGKLTLGGKNYTIPKTTFDASGNATVTPKGSPAIQLAIHIDPATHEITANVTGAVVAALTASPSPFGKKAPAPGGAVGTFTGLFFATESVTTKPKGTGFGTVKVAATGSVKLAGTLADGTKISQGTMLVTDTQWPLYVSLYKGGGVITGLVTYAPMPADGDFGAVLDWIKPATSTAIYPDAFSTQLQLTAARYAAPAKGLRVLDLPDTSPNGDFVADGGAVDRIFTLDTKNKITFADPNPEQVKLSINTKSGAVSGSLMFGGKTRKLRGTLQLEQNIGAGFFLTDTESLAFGFGED